MTEFKEWPNDPIDLLVGGTPCQSFSVAGLRKGLDDPRGNLMLTYLAIAERYQPRWLVWENVPGVLSSNRGRDFGTFLAALGQIGYGFAYRVLDAQYFGVAQRRRRVFVVGYLGDWRRAAAVLFERESLSGHPAPSREAREEATGYTATSSGKYSEGVGTVRAAGGDLGGGSETLHVAKCLTRGVGQRYDPETEALPVVFGAQNSAKQGDSVSNEVTPTLDKSKTPAVAYGLTTEQTPKFSEEKALTLTKQSPTGGGQPQACMTQDTQVRRLTPTECERLQGFPDNYTQIAWRNKAAEDCPDGPRYKAMGNSMAVPVMRWIGERIKMVEGMK
jgi:DNA (cytosine-5)-methyltransferase 1